MSISKKPVLFFKLLAGGYDHEVNKNIFLSHVLCIVKKIVKYIKAYRYKTGKSKNKINIYKKKYSIVHHVLHVKDVIRERRKRIR